MKHDEPAEISALLEIIETDKGSKKFAAAKVIRSISENTPQLLYPYFDRVAILMDSPNKIIKWGAIVTITNLIEVDSEQKFLAIYDRFFDFIKSDSMITAANTAGNAWKVAKKYPQYESDITKRLLDVANRKYFNKGEVSPECQRILCGHVLDCFDHYFELSSEQDEIIGFAQGLTNCERKAVATKAQKFVKKHNFE